MSDLVSSFLGTVNSGLNALTAGTGPGGPSRRLPSSKFLKPLVYSANSHANNANSRQNGRLFSSELPQEQPILEQLSSPSPQDLPFQSAIPIQKIQSDVPIIQNSQSAIVITPTSRDPRTLVIDSKLVSSTSTSSASEIDFSSSTSFSSSSFPTDQAESATSDLEPASSTSTTATTFSSEATALDESSSSSLLSIFASSPTATSLPQSTAASTSEPFIATNTSLSPSLIAGISSAAALLALLAFFIYHVHLRLSLDSKRIKDNELYNNQDSLDYIINLENKYPEEKALSYGYGSLFGYGSFLMLGEQHQLPLSPHSGNGDVTITSISATKRSNTAHQTFLTHPMPAMEERRVTRNV